LPGPREVVVRLAAQRPREDALQRLALRLGAALVQEEDVRPRRALLVVAVAAGERDGESRDVDVADLPVLDDPGERAEADAVRRAPAGPPVDPPAGANDVAVAGLEVAARDVP